MVLLAHLAQRSTAGSCVPSEDVHGFLDGDGVDLTEYCLYKRNYIDLDLAGCLEVTLKILVDHCGCKLGNDIGDNRDNTLASERSHGNGQSIFTRIVYESVAAEGEGLGNLGEIALLDGYDILYVCKAVEYFRRDVYISP